MSQAETNTSVTEICNLLNYKMDLASIVVFLTIVSWGYSYDIKLRFFQSSREASVFNASAAVPFDQLYRCKPIDHSLALKRYSVKIDEADEDTKVDSMSGCLNNYLNKDNTCILGEEDALDALEQNDVDFIFVSSFYRVNIEIFSEVSTGDVYYGAKADTGKRILGERIYINEIMYDRVQCLPFAEFIANQFKSFDMLRFDSCIGDFHNYRHLQASYFIFGRKNSGCVIGDFPKPSSKSFNCELEVQRKAMIIYSKWVYVDQEINYMQALQDCRGGVSKTRCTFGLKSTASALREGKVGTLVINSQMFISTSVYISSVDGSEYYVDKVHRPNIAEEGNDVIVSGTLFYFKKCLPFLEHIAKQFNHTKIIKNTACVRGFDDLSFYLSGGIADVQNNGDSCCSNFETHKETETQV